MSGNLKCDNCGCEYHRTEFKRCTECGEYLCCPKCQKDHIATKHTPEIRFEYVEGELPKD